MLLLILLSAIVTPPGESAAMDAFQEGRLSLVYIGELPPVGFRDIETGLLLESLGCEWDRETELFSEDWNKYMVNVWSYLGSDSTFFTIRSNEESLVYKNCELVYKDSWGAVPLQIFPEELASLVAISGYSLRDSFDNIVYVEMYTPLWQDTLRTELPLSSTVINNWFARGRREIRRNQMID